MSNLRSSMTGEEVITLHIVKKPRLRRIRIVVDHTGAVCVQVPTRLPFRDAQRFIAKEQHWIRTTVEKMHLRMKREKRYLHLTRSRDEYLALRSDAEVCVRTHISALSIPYAHRIACIRIGNQKTRWGSCSRRGSLRFNYHIVHLPAGVQRYLVAHEIAHLLHMNHSKDFWREVARLMPTYKEERSSLRGYRLSTH